MNQNLVSRGIYTCAMIGLSLGSFTAAEAQVLRFERTTDTIRVPVQTMLSSQATFEARIKIPSGGTSGGFIYREQANGDEDKSLYVYDYSALGTAWSSPSYQTRPSFASTANTIVDGLWHHVAFVRDGSEERFYLDGVRVYSAAWSELIRNSSASGPLAIGASQFGFYVGAPLISVDWLRLSNVARYTGAISSPPPCEPSSDASTLALFLFNDLPGSTTVVDSGPAHAHGTVAIGFLGATSPLFEGNPSQNGKPSFTQPTSRTICRQDTAMLSLAAVGSGPFTYTWRKDGTPIDPLVNPSAATPTLTLTLTNVTSADIASYDCIVTNACGSVTSNPVTLTICLGDFNCDGGINGEDIESFFLDWEAGNASADVNEDGGIDGSDVELFFTRWEAGC